MRTTWLISSLCLLFLCMGCPSADDDAADDDAGDDDGGDDDGGDDDSGPDLPEGVHLLDGIDPTLPADDLAPLGLLVGDARVVALGESAHAAGGQLQMKHRLIRYLIEEQGFRAFALESDWEDVEAAAAYVATCQGDPADVVRDHLRLVWHDQSTADLLQWLCEWNQDHPGDEVAFFGFNTANAWYDGPALVAFAEVQMKAEAKVVVPGIQRCEGATSTSEEDYVATSDGTVDQADFDACIAALDLVEAHLVANDAALLAALGEDALTVLWMRLEGIRGWEMDAMYEPLPEGLSARDAAMAYLFQAQWGRVAPDADVVISSHSLHINTHSDAVDCVYPEPGASVDYWEGVVRMGNHLADALGDDYRTLSIVSNHHTWAGSWVEPPVDELPDMPKGPPIIEVLLHDLGQTTLFVDLAFPGAETAFLTPGEEYRTAYPIPILMDLETGVLQGVPADWFDALIYLDEDQPWTQL